jgi:ABC-type phosphate transport system substrate-binding protein
MSVALLGWFASLGVAASAPTVSCADPQLRPQIVYVAGSSAAQPYLAVMAKLAAASGRTIVYQSQGSCTGVTAIFSADPSARVIKDIPATGTAAANYAVFFAPDGTATPCLLDPMGNTVDIGLSDVFAETCGVTQPPPDVTIGDYHGPIQPMVFVVPASSPEHVISAEAAYFAFGFGDATPWDDPSLFFVRNAKSGTQSMIGKAIGVPASVWHGVDRGSTAGVRDQMKLILDSATAAKAIGILVTDVADDQRVDLRTLAFQARGQISGFLPDSSPAAFDKRNVRDGHYQMWGPMHFYARTSAGIPDTAAQAVINQIGGQHLDESLLDAIIARHIVPECAMAVQRSTEVGPLSSYQSPSPCGCYFEARATGSPMQTGRSSCAVCATTADCKKGVETCSYGYCEAQ